MELYFNEYTKLRRNLYYLVFLISIIIAIIAWIVGKDVFLGVMYAFVAFVFLRIIVNNYVQKKDDKAFNSLLNILYDQRKPKSFLIEIKDKIDFKNLNKKQITTFLTHKAIAKCYNGDIVGAIDLLKYAEQRTDDDNALLKLSFYHILFKIIDEKMDGVNEEILAFKELLKLKMTEKLLKSNLKSDKIQIKYLKFFENKILECELLEKIVNHEKLSNDNDEFLKSIIEGATSKLNYEMLHYFSAINKISEGDEAGASVLLAKIETTPICNTIIQTRSLKLKNEIE